MGLASEALKQEAKRKQEAEKLMLRLTQRAKEIRAELDAENLSRDQLLHALSQSRAILEHMTELDAKRERLKPELLRAAMDYGWQESRRKQHVENAHKRHSENRAMKEQIFDWLDENWTTEKTMEQLTNEIHAAKLVPLTWGTVRRHVTEWKKRTL